MSRPTNARWVRAGNRAILLIVWVVPLGFPPPTFAQDAIVLQSKETTGNTDQTRLAITTSSSTSSPATITFQNSRVAHLSNFELWVDSNNDEAATFSIQSGVTPANVFTVNESGQITLGTWQGSAIGVSYGGTGATTASGARTNIGAAAAGSNADITSLSMTDASTSPALSINKTGSSGNLLTLQKSGADKFTLSNAGNIVTFADAAGGTDKEIRAQLNRLVLQADTSIVVMLDADNNSTASEFTVRTNGSTSSLFSITEAGALTATYTDADAGTDNAVTVEKTNSAGVGADGIGAAILLRAEDALSQIENVAQIAGILTSATDTTEASALSFSTRTAGGALTERMRIQSDGTLAVGSTSSTDQTATVYALSTSTDAAIRGDVTGSPSGTSMAGFFNNLSTAVAGSVLGVKGAATGSGSGSTHYGLYGEASGGTTNWAGYFTAGDVGIENKLTFVSTTNGNSKLRIHRTVVAAPAVGNTTTLYDDGSVMKIGVKSFNANEVRIMFRTYASATWDYSCIGMGRDTNGSDLDIATNTGFIARSDDLLTDADTTWYTCSYDLYDNVPSTAQIFLAKESTSTESIYLIKVLRYYGGPWFFICVEHYYN